MEGRRGRRWPLVAGAAVVGLLALAIVGAPLGTVLAVGLSLLCPLAMAGMHGAGRRGHEDAHDHGAGGGCHGGGHARENGDLGRSAPARDPASGD